MENLFWEEVENTLKDKHLTIYKLSKLTGIPDTTLRYNHSNHSKTSLISAFKIAKILDISLDELKKNVEIENVEIDKQSDRLIKPHKMHVTTPKKGSTEFLNIVYELESKYGSIGAIPLNDKMLHKAWKLIDPNKNINETVQKWSKLTVKTRNRRY